MLYKGNITLSEKSGMEKIITLASECNYYFYQFILTMTCFVI